MKTILEFVHIADNVIQSDDGKVSIIGIFNNIKKIPAVISFYVVTRLSQVPSKTKSVTVRIFGPKGDMFQEINISGSVGKDNKVGIIARFDGIEFIEKGKYVVKVFLDGSNEEISKESETSLTAGAKDK